VATEVPTLKAKRAALSSSPALPAFAECHGTRRRKVSEAMLCVDEAA
jgi:hypothetical protein